MRPSVVERERERDRHIHERTAPDRHTHTPRRHNTRERDTHTTTTQHQRERQTHTGTKTHKPATAERPGAETDTSKTGGCTRERLIQYRAGRSHQPHRPLGKYREKRHPAQPSSCLQLSNPHWPRRHPYMTRARIDDVDGHSPDGHHTHHSPDTDEPATAERLVPTHKEEAMPRGAYRVMPRGTKCSHPDTTSQLRLND